MSDLCRRNIRDPPFALILESNKNTYFLVLVCFVWGSRNEKLFSFLKTVIGKLWLISRKMCFRNTINRVYFSCKHNTIELLSLKGIEYFFSPDLRQPYFRAHHRPDRVRYNIQEHLFSLSFFCLLLFLTKQSSNTIDELGRYDLPMMFGITVMFFSTLMFACGRWETSMTAQLWQ